MPHKSAGFLIERGYRGCPRGRPMLSREIGETEHLRSRSADYFPLHPAGHAVASILRAPI